MQFSFKLVQPQMLYDTKIIQFIHYRTTLSSLNTGNSENLWNKFQYVCVMQSTPTKKIILFSCLQ